MKKNRNKKVLILKVNMNMYKKLKIKEIVKMIMIKKGDINNIIKK